MALPAWASDRGSHSSFIPVPSPCQHIFWRGDHPVRSPFSGVLAAPSLYSRPLPNCRYAGWGLTLLLPSFSSCLLYQLSILRHKYRHKSKGWCSRQGLLQEVKELSLAGGQGRFGRGRKRWSRTRRHCWGFLGMGGEDGNCFPTFEGPDV